MFLFSKHLANNTQWKVYHTCATNKIIRTSDDLDWWVNSYIVFMERETTYYMYNLILPCFLLSTLSMLLFKVFYEKNLLYRCSYKTDSFWSYWKVFKFDFKSFITVYILKILNQLKVKLNLFKKLPPESGKCYFIMDRCKGNFL